MSRKNAGGIDKISAGRDITLICYILYRLWLRPPRTPQGVRLFYKICDRVTRFFKVSHKLKFQIGVIT